MELFKIPVLLIQFEVELHFSFSVAPKPEDKIDVFFYRGTRSEDDLVVDDVIPTLERGDDIRVFKNDTIQKPYSRSKNSF